MRAGDLSDPIEIYSVDPNTGGGQHLARVWANVQVPAGNEAFETEEEPRQQAGTVTIRALATVVRKMRIAFGTRIFEIQTITSNSDGSMLLGVGELRAP